MLQQSLILTDLLKKLYFLSVILSVMVMSSCDNSPIDYVKTKFKGVKSVQQDAPIQEIARLSTKMYIDDIALSPDSRYLAALSNYGSTITLWDTRSWEKINECILYSRYNIDHVVRFLTNRSIIIATPGGESSDPSYVDQSKYFCLSECDACTGKLIRHLPGQPVVHASPTYRSAMEYFSVSNDGKLIVGIEKEPSSVVSVLDAHTGKKLFSRMIPVEWGVDLSESRSSKNENINRVVFSPDGKRVAIGTGSEQRTENNKTIAAGGRVYILDSTTGQILNSFWAYRWEPDNYLDRPDSNGIIRGRNKDIYQVRDLIFSPNGRFIATGKYQMGQPRILDPIAATIWEAATGRKVFDIQGKVIDIGGGAEICYLTAMAWRGDLLALGDSSGALRMYSVKDPGKPVLIYRDDPRPDGIIGVGLCVNTIILFSGGMLVYCRDNKIYVLKINNR
jgi:WD40 repeat protein